MFAKVKIFSLLSFALLSLAWVGHFSFAREKEREACRAMLTMKETSSAIPSSVHQIRGGVHKEIWFAQEDGSRLEHRIESRSSVLSLLSRNQKWEVLENLKEMRCWLQDKQSKSGESPMQQLRFLEADKGTYNYTLQELIAQSVALSLFRLPSKELPEKLDPQAAFLHGIAQSIIFSVNGNTPQFQAQNFKAQFTK